MIKPYSDMLTQNHFTILKQEQSDFLHILQTFTDPGHMPNPECTGKEGLDSAV